MSSEVSSTFSESWYRVASQRICLRPGIVARRQNYRGERWIVLENPFSNQFFRLRPEAYEFVARLRPDRTVEQVWQECLARFPDSAPGQEAVIQLLSQLYFSNLLQYDTAVDAAQLFERYKKRRQREVGSRWLNIMFMRFPLFDPDRFLVRTLPYVGKLISVFGALLWLVVVGFGVKVVAENSGGLWDETQSVLSPGNLPLLYLSLIVVKTLHEFGHAFFCRKWGGEVHVMGVMLMIFTPIPYVDATSSWGFRSKWRRAMVGSAGMIVEIFLAAIAAMVWANTGPGAAHSIAHNIMFVASVSTLVFNLNPLLRFDGYYILSDLIEVPNLHQRSTQQLRHLFERYVFGVKRSESPALTNGGAFGYATFGLLSGAYRFVVFGGILLAIADEFLIIGLIMAVICLISWITVPIIRLIRYLASAPRLERVRKRAVLATVAIIAGVFVLLQLIPFPNHFRAPGVVRATERTEMSSEVAGELDVVHVKPGTPVVAGQPLLGFKNRELELELAEAEGRAAEIEVRLLKAMKDESADLKPLMKSREAIAERVAKLKADVQSLTVRARHNGVWVAPGIQEFRGRWMPRGSNLGLLVNPASFEFVATVLQEDANSVFAKPISGAEVRLMSGVGTALEVGEVRVIPGEQRQLPSPALGWRGGGDVPVEMNDERGSKAAEPYFKVIAKLPANAGTPLFDGVSGRMRFDLGTEPLLTGWYRSLKQLLQKRYQL
jgi:putative peptide zinc metalloprotease protein